MVRFLCHSHKNTVCNSVLLLHRKDLMIRKLRSFEIYNKTLALRIPTVSLTARIFCFLQQFSSIWFHNKSYESVIEQVEQLGELFELLEKARQLFSRRNYGKFCVIFFTFVQNFINFFFWTEAEIFSIYPLIVGLNHNILTSV